MVSSWETSFRRSRHAGLITMADWAAVMHSQLTKILDREYVRVTVAFDGEDPDHIYGYLVAEPDEHPPLVYWAYVKQPYRRQGLCKALFKAAGISLDRPMDVVCSTPWLSQKLPRAEWRPLRGRYSREHREHVRD